eukprot:c3324_g2_i1 orf=13-288(-)
MVDLLGRAGQLDKAVSWIKGMPCSPNFVLWHAVLGACKYWGNFDFARKALELTLGCSEAHDGAYIPQSHSLAGVASHDKVNIDEGIKVVEV